MLDYLRNIDPLPRSVRRFQKQRDVLIAELLAAGEVASPTRIAQELGVSAQKYVMLLRIVAAAEPISIHESTIASGADRLTPVYTPPNPEPMDSIPAL